jgi:chromosome segregation protein
LVFAGNEKIKPSSCASVKLLFEDIEKKEGIDFNTLEVERSISLDGKSDYFINNQPCRLKDVVEVFSSLKLGVKGFSIVNQGTIEDILRISSGERVVMFQEILGLRQLEIKKESSVKKLNLTFENLNQVAVLENEILPHFRSLKRQVSRIEKSEEIKKELHDIEYEYFSFLYNKLQKVDNSLDIKEIEDKINILEKECKDMGLNFNKNFEFEKEKQVIEKEIRELNNQKSNLLYDLAKVESLVEVNKNKLNDNLKSKYCNVDLNIINPKIENILKYFKVLYIEKDFNKTMQLIKGLENEVQLLIANFNINNVNSDLVKKEILELEEKVQEIKNKNILIQDNINVKYAKLDEISNLEKQKMNENQEKFLIFEKKQKEINDLKYMIRSFEIDQEKYNLQLSNLEREIKESTIEFDLVVKNSISLKESEFYDKEKKMYRLRKMLNEIGFVDKEIEDEYLGVKERIEFLSKEKEDLEKSIKDLNKLVKDLEKEINTSFDVSLKQINLEFNKYLKILFDGGKGSIEIVKDEEGSNIGVDIFVKLPKNKLEGIEALSGGEKSLVSLALLFAIVSISTPPLLVLDEVDAALDEENARKFGEILNKLSNKTQFILITHN